MAVHAHQARLRSPVVAADRSVWQLAQAGIVLFALGAAFLTVTMLAASIAPAYDYGAAPRFARRADGALSRDRWRYSRLLGATPHRCLLIVRPALLALRG